MRFVWLLSFSLLAAPALAQTSVDVTTAADAFDAVPDASCALREAIQTANTGAPFGGCVPSGTGVPTTVHLPAGTYVLTRGGAAEFDRSRAAAPPPVPEARRSDVQSYFIRKP